MREPRRADGRADAMGASIAELWRESQPRALARVETLEDAVTALMAGALDDDLRAAARQEAHRLTGSLGTFGIPDGSVAAAALERALVDPDADAVALAAHVAALRRAVEGPAADA